MNILPIECIYDICIFLDCKSLIKFKLVCKNISNIDMFNNRINIYKNCYLFEKFVYTYVCSNYNEFNEFIIENNKEKYINFQDIVKITELYSNTSKKKIKQIRSMTIINSKILIKN